MKCLVIVTTHNFEQAKEIVDHLIKIELASNCLLTAGSGHPRPWVVQGDYMLFATNDLYTVYELTIPLSLPAPALRQRIRCGPIPFSSLLFQWSTYAKQSRIR